MASKLACAGVRSAPKKNRRLLRSQREHAPSPQQARSHKKHASYLSVAVGTALGSVIAHVIAITLAGAAITFILMQHATGLHRRLT